MVKKPSKSDFSLERVLIGFWYRKLEYGYNLVEDTIERVISLESPSGGKNKNHQNLFFSGNFLNKFFDMGNSSLAMEKL